MKSARKRILLLLLCAALLPGCGKAEEPAEETNDNYIEVGDTVSGEVLTAGEAADSVFSLSVDFDDGKYPLHPLRTKSSANLMISPLVFDNLFELDENFVLSSRLVTDYYSNEEGTYWYIKIDSTIPMHDGTTLDAYDVAYSINRARMYSDYFKARLSNVSGCSAYSESELAVSTAYSDMLLPYRLVIPVVKNKSIETTNPAGSGPYMFGFTSDPAPALPAVTAEGAAEGAAPAEGEPAPEPTATPEPTPTPEPAAETRQPDCLVAFSGYSGEGQAPIDTIYLRPYSDPATLINEYESALVDLVVNDPTSNYNMGYGGKNEKRVYPTTHMHYLGFNGYSKFLCYATYRRCLNWIVDREHICSEELSGSAIPAALPINPNSRLYDQALADSFAYSPARGMDELKALGCGDLDGDGEMEFSISGSKAEMSIDFIVCSNSAAKVTAARRIAKDMQALGMPVTLRELSWKEFLSTLANPVDEEGHPTFDMYYDEVALTADWDLTLFFREVKVDKESKVATTLELNYGRWDVAEARNAVSAFLSAEEIKQVGAASEMCSSLADLALIIPVCFETRTVISHLGIIRGVKSNQDNIFANVTNWTINLPKDE